MHFATLENTTPEEILEAFNLSFSDYKVPLQLSMQDFENRLTSNNVDLKISAGAFDNSKLMGFILHGIRHQKENYYAYNAGTGVIPDYRGNKITSGLYDFILPRLISRKVQQVILEVITDNEAAINVYAAADFHIARTLNCYKGNLSADRIQYDDVKEIKEYKWDEMLPFSDWSPSWQNDIEAVEQNRSINKSLGIFEGNDLKGYIIFNPATARVQQFAIHPAYRRQGLGTRLFEVVSGFTNGHFVLINVDADADDTNAFLKSLGFELFITQYEMKKILL